MSSIKDFVLHNLKVIIIVISFLVTMYVQHLNNVAHVAELKERCLMLELKLQDQYDRINAMKLDKSVFEATMLQFSSIQTDLREMRGDIKELLKNRR